MHFNLHLFIIIIVSDNGSVYSLKVDDIEVLSAIIEQDLENAKGNTEEEKVLNKKNQGKFSKDAENTERVFLKEFGNYGLSIYKATDENLSNWTKLELDANDNENVTETPCN